MSASQIREKDDAILEHSECSIFIATFLTQLQAFPALLILFFLPRRERRFVSRADCSVADEERSKMIKTIIIIIRTLH